MMGCWKGQHPHRSETAGMPGSLVTPGWILCAECPWAAGTKAACFSCWRAPRCGITGDSGDLHSSNSLTGSVSNHKQCIVNTVTCNNNVKITVMFWFTEVQSWLMPFSDPIMSPHSAKLVSTGLKMHKLKFLQNDKGALCLTDVSYR